MGTVTLITGGARSGKSAHALALAHQAPGARRFFIATAEALDDEMHERIAHHRANRSTGFATIEEPLAIGGALSGTMAEAPFASIVVTDEVGAGIVPDNPTARRFRDLLGWTNQAVAQAAESVVLMVAGYPLRVT